MGLDQMAHLVTYVASLTIVHYATKGSWVDEDLRRDLVMRWLQRNDHNASHWKLTKLSITADGVARQIVYDAPEIADIFPTLTDEEQNEMYEEIYISSQQALLYKGITS